MLIKKEMKRSLIKKGYIICSVFIAYISSMYLWYWNVNSGWIEEYSGVSTLIIVGTLYAATYWFLAKMYKASQIGIYRLTELMLFQALSYGIADTFLLAESIIWFHNFYIFDIKSVVGVFVAQILLSMVCIMVCNRIYERYDEPRKVMIVYGNQNYESFVKKLLSKNYRYNIVACHKDDENIVVIKESVDKCFAVYLYDVTDKPTVEDEEQMIFLYNELEPYMVTNMTIDEMLELADCSFNGKITPLEGEVKVVNNFLQFHVDNEKLQLKILDLFYK